MKIPEFFTGDYIIARNEYLQVIGVSDDYKVLLVVDERGAEFQILKEEIQQKIMRGELKNG